MKRLINWILGYVTVTAEGAFPERLLNLCAQHRLPFWGLVWHSETSFSLRVRLADRSRLEELARRAMCSLEEGTRRGVTAAALRWRKRWGFVAGLVLAFLAVTVLSRFVLVVEVTGNERVSSAVILSELQSLGVRPGVYGPGLDRPALANKALRALPELSFLAINRYGTRLEVEVREAVPAPGILDETTPADVIAAADGIILDIHTAAGQPRFEDGDTVTRGEVLISGDVELRKPQGSAYDMGKLVVHAAGTVTARTWRTMEAMMPLTAGEKTYTGAETRFFSASILWWNVDFYGNSRISYEKYDKIKETRSLCLFGRELPLALTWVTVREYTLSGAEVDAAAARSMLERDLTKRLEQILDSREGTVARTDFVAREQGGVLTVTMLCECVEQIGKTVERPGRTGRVYEHGSPAGE